MTTQPSGSQAAEPPAGRSARRRVGAGSARPAYYERLRTPLWWYLGAATVAVLLGAEFAFAVSGPITWIPLLVLLPVCLLVVWRLSSGTVAVVGSQLVVPAGALDLSDVDRAIGLSAAELRRLVGRHSDPIAFVYVRSWIGPGVQLVLRRSTTQRSGAHPDLAVPYWVVSTRRPDRLLAALRAADVPTS